jgi:WD40 repeat protein
MGFISSLRDGRAGMRIGDPATPGSEFELPWDFWVVRELRFSRDGRWVALSGMMEHWIMVRDATTGAEVLPIRGHPEQVITFEFSPDARRIAAACHGGRVVVWDVRPPEDE